MAAAQSELSMDEILASIRRIIHEEETPAEPRRSEGNTVALEEERRIRPEVRAVDDNATVKPMAWQDFGSAEQENASTEPKTDAPRPAPTPAKAKLAKSEPQRHAPEPQPRTERAEPPEPAAQRAAPQPEPAADAADVAVEKPASGHESAPAPSPAASPAPEVSQPQAEPTSTVQEQPAQPEETAMGQPAEKFDDVNLQPRVAAATETAVSNAFTALKRNIQVSQTADGTLEDMIRDMLRPMLAQWLDDNLPAIVDRKVDEEIKRLSTQG